MGGLVRGLYLRADAALCQLLAPFVGRPGWRSAHLQPLATDAGPTDARDIGDGAAASIGAAGHALVKKCVLGEGPLWDADTATVYWLDVALQRLHAFRPSTAELRTSRVPPVTSAAVKCVDGGLLIATRRGIGRFDPDTTRFDLIPETAPQWPRNRYNDGKCDRAGRFWTGTMRLEGSPGREKLFRFDPARGLACMDDGFTVCNGLGWSPDDRRFYLADTFDRCVYVYDFDLNSGAIENRRVFARWPEAAGAPDGLTVDADACVWVASARGWRLTRFDPDGKVERTLKTPVPRPTSCTFGGPNLDTLFVTSSRLGLSRREFVEAPQSGDLLIIDPGVVGLAEPAFACGSAKWN
jgi:sugar lactone lactonase YvrE